tara:strand:+ start:3650 stop:5254 length:1605 start_codon:yes stop_codon:yes gene_type:complete
MRIVELILDENELSGIEAISIVENPAIEEEFIALKKQEVVYLAEADKEKKILVGALLVPNKPIYRKKDDDEYYIYFSKDTVRKASEIYLQKGNQNNATLEHQYSLKGLTLVESWIVEDTKFDKSRKYGLDVPVGTWMGTIKVNNEQIWEEFIKTGKVKGFSIEGYFADKAQIKKEDKLSKYEEDEAQELLSEIKGILRNNLNKGYHVTLESYDDYPEAVRNNAKRGIELNKKVKNKCATDVGKIRAQQLAKGKPISENTIKRMYSFLSRAEEYYKPEDNEACGTISYLLWGGKAGKRYAEAKLKELGKLDLYSQKVNDDFAIILDRLAYASKDMAVKIAKDIGCEGIHEHEYEGQVWFMPCEKHALGEEEFRKYKCPEGYVKDYKKHKCVKKDKLAKIGKRGGIIKSPKAPASDTPNPNPKGKGTAKGTAKDSRSAKVSQRDEKALQKKADDFNERYKKKLGYGVTVGQLRAVFQRGLGAFNTSRSPRIKSPSAWAQARVNAYLYLVKNGRPQNPKYVTDNDLLPSKHPKSTKK